MADGVYQSAISFFMVYLLYSPATFVTANGLGLDELKRMGIMIATIAVCAANFYILMNSYRWDWLIVLIVIISTLFTWFWTGVYSSVTASAQFYKAGAEVYGSLTFWAVLLVAFIVCLLPRFVVKTVQKIYFPLDVDIIREQVSQGKFDYLNETDAFIPPPPPAEKISSVTSSESSKYKAAKAQTGDDDMRPIYPPSVAPTAGTHNARSQNGSNSTDYTFRRSSLEAIPSHRLSLDRPRPSFDRARMSMDRVRPSFEASNDFTSAAMLARMESRNSISGPTNPPSHTMSKLRNAFRRPTVTREDAPELNESQPPLPKPKSPPSSPPR